MVSRVVGLARVGYELHHFHKIRNLFGDSMPTTRFKNMMLDFFARSLATVNFWQKTTWYNRFTETGFRKQGTVTNAITVTNITVSVSVIAVIVVVAVIVAVVDVVVVVVVVILGRSTRTKTLSVLPLIVYRQRVGDNLTYIWWQVAFITKL